MRLRLFPHEKRCGVDAATQAWAVPARWAKHLLAVRASLKKRLREDSGLGVVAEAAVVKALDELARFFDKILGSKHF